MLGTPTAITAVLGAAPPADADTARLKSFARAACQAGLHLLLIEPGGKTPVDMRSPVQRRNDDGLAQDAARAAMRPGWDKVKSKGGVYLATNSEVLITRYIDRYRKFYSSDSDVVPVNFAVSVGPSNLIVVDCDTREQVEAFLRDAADAAGVAHNLDIPPTVRSPGQRDGEGNWAHKDGGHYYFTTDEPMPSHSGSLTASGGYVVLWSRRYVLIPPSVREEGPYYLAGQDFPASPWLRGVVEAAVNRKILHSQGAASSPQLTDAIDQWSSEVSWDDVLSPQGWTPTARQDNCGCDIWTAPGAHASPKSATAHDTGCGLDRYTQENAPLHIWTDNPGPELEEWIAAHGGSKTLSKLQTVAALEYGGQVGTAMRALSVTPDNSERLSFGGGQDRDLGVSKTHLDDPIPAPIAGTYTLGAPGVDTQTFDFTGKEIEPEVTPDPFVIAGSAAPEDDADTDEDTETEDIAGVPEIMPFSYWRNMPAPEFVIEGLLEHRGFAAVVGAPGIGKALALDTPLATPLGWTTMGAVKVGDFIIGDDGRPTRVVATTDVMTDRECYELTFSDGAAIVADAEHMWAVTERQGRKHVIRTTAHICSTVRTGRDPAANYKIRNASALRLPNTVLPIPSYTMGAWLGDGTSKSNGFTSADTDIPRLIESEGLDVRGVGAHPMAYSLHVPVARDRCVTPSRECAVCGERFTPSTTAVRTCGKSCGGKYAGPKANHPVCAVCGGSAVTGFGPCRDCYMERDTFTGRLRRVNVLGNKHIPPEYQRASEPQRRALLAGLLDTDGTVTKGGSVQFTGTCERLVRDVRELITGLGYRSGMSTKYVKGRTAATSIAYTLTFATPDDVFRLPRKAVRHRERRSTTDARSGFRYIVDVHPVASVPVKCIQVDNESHMYVAGTHMIPTHNSGVVLDMAAAISTGRRWMGRKTMHQPVLYLPGEGLSGAVQRLLAWESAHDVDLGESLIVGDSVIQVAASQEAWSAVVARILKFNVGLIIIDTFARASVGLEENSATDIGRAIAKFDRVRKATNAGLIVVHHTGKSGGTRGSSALNGALDTELLISEGGWWDYANDGPPPGRPLDCFVTKQKNAAQPEHGVPMMAVTHGDSFIMTGPSGVIGDPLDDVHVVKSVTPEPVITTAIRIAEYVERFPMQGLTRTELAYGVAPDDYTNQRRDAKLAWRMKIGAAVDLGLRYQLIQTLTGTASGARYIPDVTTADQARQRWASEAMSD